MCPVVAGVGAPPKAKDIEFEKVQKSFWTGASEAGVTYHCEASRFWNDCLTVRFKA